MWLGGAGSLAALAIAHTVLRAPDSGRRARATAWRAVRLAALGLLLTALMVLGAVSEHQHVT